MRDALKARLEEGGRYKVVDQPGPDVLYMRTALTNLYLKKKKRGVLAYTPIGAVAKAGTDALKDTLDKVDIIEMALRGGIRGQQVERSAGSHRRRGRRAQGGRAEGTTDGHG